MLLNVVDGPCAVNRRTDSCTNAAVKRKAQTALMYGDFKLVKTWSGNRLELFDLSKDIREENDLSRERPEKTRALHEQMKTFLKNVNAETRRKA